MAKKFDPSQYVGDESQWHGYPTKIIPRRKWVRLITWMRFNAKDFEGQGVLAIRTLARMKSDTAKEKGLSALGINVEIGNVLLAAHIVGVDLKVDPSLQCHRSNHQSSPENSDDHQSR